MIRIKTCILQIISFGLLFFSSFLAAQEIVLVSPAPGSTITSSSVTFSWTAQSGTTAAFLSVGTTESGTDVFDSNRLPSGAMSLLVENLPTDKELYVTIWSEAEAEPGAQFPNGFRLNVDTDSDGILNTIDGNPVVADEKRVLTGDGYTLTVLGSGRVASLESSSLFSSASATMNFEDTAAISKIVYDHMNDAFDFLVVASNLVSVPANATYAGQLQGVSNDVFGTGILPYSSASLFGNPKKLQGFMHLPSTSGLSNGPSLHEYMHAWGNNMASIPSIAAGHWGASNIGGQLGGWQPNSLESLGNNRYRAKDPSTGEIGSWGGFANGGNGLPYSKFELYLMGLIDANEVGHDIKIARDFAWVDQNTGVFSASSITSSTMDEIIAAEGRRSPGKSESQKSFRSLYLILTDKPLTNSEWVKVDEDAYKFALKGDDGSSLFNFWEGTGGRASMQMDGLMDVLKEPGVGNSNNVSPLPVSVTSTEFTIEAQFSCLGDASDGAMEISPNTPVTLDCSFEIDSFDVAKAGSTYMIIQAEGIGAFQVNEAGAFIPWDGAVSSLVPASKQVFSTSASLMPFNNIKFADFGVTNANLTVLFAYKTDDSTNFIFTPQGVKVTIQN